MSGKLAKLLQQHISCQVSIEETPGKVHYGKLVCVACGNHRGPKFLTWLSIEEMVLTGKYNSEQDIQAAKQRKAKLLKNNKPKKTTRWSQATEKERNFYKSYQPLGSLGRSNTPAQMIGDRLCVEGKSKYNGNSIYSIPHAYLKQLLASGKIRRKEEQALIQAANELQTGSYSTPPSN